MRKQLAASVATYRDQRRVLFEAGAPGQLPQHAIGGARQALEQPFDRPCGLEAGNQCITLQSQAVPQLEADVVHRITRWQARARAFRPTRRRRIAAARAWLQTG